MKTWEDSNDACKGDLWVYWDYFLSGHIQFTIFDEAQNLKLGGKGERSKNLLSIQSDFPVPLTVSRECRHARVRLT